MHRVKSKHRRMIMGWLVLSGLVGIVPVTHVITRLRLGWRANLILVTSTRVEPLRVVSPGEAADPEPGHATTTFGPADPMVDYCYIIARGKMQGTAFKNRLADILLDEGTYTIAENACETQPGVIFRVWRGAQSLDVVLCFHCGEMYTVTHDAGGKQTRGVYTLMTGYSRPAFIALAKEAFPNDPEIRAL